MPFISIVLLLSLPVENTQYSSTSILKIITKSIIIKCYVEHNKIMKVRKATRAVDLTAALV